MAAIAFGSIRQQILSFSKRTLERGRQTPKKFYFPDQESQAVLDKLISDEAYMTDSTVSAVIVDCLVRSLLPESPTARRWVIHAAYSEDGDGVKGALGGIFRDNAAGVNWHAAHDNARPLVELAERMLRERSARYAGKFDGDDPTFHMRSCFDSMVGKVESAYNDTRHVDESYPLREAVAHGRMLLSTLDYENRAHWTYPFHIARYALDNWEQLGDYSYTFRCLSSLLESCAPFQEHPRDRMEFRAACEEVMSAWDASAAAEAARKAEETRKSRQARTMRQVDIMGGYVRVPDDWIVLREDKACSCRNAYVISVRGVDDVPPFLFFTNSENMRDEAERLAVVEEAAAMWPRFNEVIEKDAASDGTEVCIGMFKIPNANKDLCEQPPYGAAVYRDEID